MVCVATSIGLGVGFSVVANRVLTPPDVEELQVPSGVQLAQALTAALNAHDVDALVDLFTEEDAGPTITADRVAWQKFEIRRWGQQQVQAGIRIEADDYRVTQHGAAWTAAVFRQDWSEHGVAMLPVRNSVWVHNGRLAIFSSQPKEPRDLQRLGRLWQPGLGPEEPTPALTPVASRLAGQHAE